MKFEKKKKITQHKEAFIFPMFDTVHMPRVLFKTCI